MTAEAQRPLTDLLEALAARTPAPGAGCASAWSGALGAALLEMTAGLAGEEEIAARAQGLRAVLLDAGELELHSYEPVLEALRLPAEDPRRAQALDDALSGACSAPLAIANACAEAAELGAEVVARSSPAVRGDAIAAVLLAESATAAAARLVEINLARRPSDPRLGEAAGLAQRASAARQNSCR